ncbi:MAG: hypothetical protein RL291_518 [Pseudomonadota bacterium]
MGRSQVDIDDLRAIASAHWDPFGLCDKDGSPPKGAENEYDRYMRTLARMILEGRDDYTGTRHLVDIERGTVGLLPTTDTRAAATVAALRQRLAQA